MINQTNSKVQEYRTAPLPAGVVVNDSIVLKRVDDGLGGSGVAPATGAANEDLVGVANVSPIAATARAVINEEKNATSGVVTLDWPIAGAKPSVYNVTADSAVAAADVSITGSNEITIGGTPPADSDVLHVSYSRSVTLAELSQEGLPLDYANRANGSDGAVEFATGKSDIEVDYFAADQAYAIGGDIFSNADGLLTSVDGGGDPVGTCSIVPTTENPVLGVSMDLKF